MTTTTKRNSPNKGGGPYPYTTSAGKKLWHFVATVTGPDGTRRKVHKRGFTSSSEALKAMRKVLTASDEGSYTDPSKQQFGKYLADWLDGLQLAPSTVASYRKNVRLHVAPYIGSVPLSGVTPVILTKLYRDLEKSGRADKQGGLAARTVRYIHTIVSAALRDAVDGGQLSVNPAAKAKPPSARDAKSPEMHPWNSVQVSAFLAWSKNNSGLHPAWHVLAMTGMRRGELLGLRWKDIDLDKCVIAVRRSATLVRVKGEGASVTEGPTKGGTSRVVDIDPETADVLRAHKKQRGGLALVLAQPGSLVFGDVEGRHRQPEHFSRTWNQTVRRAIRDGVDVTEVRLHDLRHSMASLWLGSGEPLKVVSERLGHASATVTLTIYNHVMPGMQREGAARMAKVLGEATS